MTTITETKMDMQNSEDMVGVNMTRTTPEQMAEAQALFMTKEELAGKCFDCKGNKIFSVPRASQYCGFCAAKRGIHDNPFGKNHRYLKDE